jgi:hypothetical protein
VGSVLSNPSHACVVDRKRLELKMKKLSPSMAVVVKEDQFDSIHPLSLYSIEIYSKARHYIHGEIGNK